MALSVCAFAFRYLNWSPKLEIICALTKKNELGENGTKIGYVFYSCIQNKTTKMDFLRTAPKTVVVTVTFYT